MYKVCGLDDSYPKNIVFEKEYEDWTDAQDKAVQLLEDDVRKDLQPRKKRVREELIPQTRDGEDEVQQEEPEEEEVEVDSK